MRFLSFRDVALFVVVLLIAVGIVRGERGRSDAIRRNRDLIVQVAQTNHRQQQTIEALCDRGYILDGLVLAAIELVKNPPHDEGDAEFIAKFRAYHQAIIRQLTDPESPCVA